MKADKLTGSELLATTRKKRAKPRREVIRRSTTIAVCDCGQWITSGQVDDQRLKRMGPDDVIESGKIFIYRCGCTRARQFRAVTDYEPIRPDKGRT